MPTTRRSKSLSARLRDVRNFCAKGRKSQKKSPHRLRYGEANRSADEFELHPEMLRKARQIAEQFPADELDRLLKQCEAKNFSIGITHLMRLATVRKGRAVLIKRMLFGRWSLRRLNTEIAKTHPSIEGRGRRRHVAADRDGRLIELKRECDRWIRWNISTDGSAAQIVDGDDSAHSLDEQGLLGKAVSRAVNEVRDKIMELRAVVVRSLRKPKRRRRS